jgi:LPXTG-site transpeptidase (sortase) family protein
MLVGCAVLLGAAIYAAQITLTGYLASNPAYLRVQSLNSTSFVQNQASLASAKSADTPTGQANQPPGSPVQPGYDFIDGLQNLADSKNSFSTVAARMLLLMKQLGLSVPAQSSGSLAMAPGAAASGALSSELVVPGTPTPTLSLAWPVLEATPTNLLPPPSPTATPTQSEAAPTLEPTQQPTAVPAAVFAETVAPTLTPTEQPTLIPTVEVTVVAQAEPTQEVPPPVPPPQPVVVAPSQPIIRLSIPRLQVKCAVVDIGIINRTGNPEWDTDRLFATKNRPDLVGHLEGSALPGESGNIVLVGHNYDYVGNGVFVNLHKVQEGDEISVTTEGGDDYVYRVIKVKQVPYPGNSSDQERHMRFLGATPDERLTLVTCGGVNIGVFNKRVYVIAERIQ